MTSEGQKGNKKKREKNISLDFERESGSGGKKSVLDREGPTSLRIPGDRAVGSSRAKKQSCSTLQGLRVGTGFGEFRQLREVGVFSYSVIFDFKSLVNGLVDLRPEVGV